MRNNFFKETMLKKLFLLAGAAVSLSSFSAQAMDDQNQNQVTTTISKLRDAYDNNTLIIDEKSGKRLRVTSIMNTILIPLEDETVVCKIDMLNSATVWSGFAHGRCLPAEYDYSETPPRLITPGIVESFYAYLEEVSGGEEKKQESKQESKEEKKS